jgi:hypothetical protein
LYIAMDEDGDNIPEVLDTLKVSNFRFVFAVLQHRDLHDTVMEAAYKRGLAGNEAQEFNWFFSDTFRSVLVNHEDRIFPKGSPLHLAYRGVGFITPAAFALDTGTRFQPSAKFETFQDSIQEIRRSSDQIEYLRTILPLDNSTGTIPFVEGYRRGLVYDTASFHYEATYVSSNFFGKLCKCSVFCSLPGLFAVFLLSQNYDGLGCVSASERHAVDRRRGFLQINSPKQF